MSKFDAQFAGRLDGQTVLVTGAKGGIGHETAQGIGNCGATVLVHARGADHADALSTCWSPTATAKAGTWP